MQARIKRIATEAEVKASSIRSHKNELGEVYVGSWCVIYAGGRINMDFLQRCTPRELALARYWGIFGWIPFENIAAMSLIVEHGDAGLINRIFSMTDLLLDKPKTRKVLRTEARARANGERRPSMAFLAITNPQNDPRLQAQAKPSLAQMAGQANASPELMAQSYGGGLAQAPSRFPDGDATGGMDWLARDLPPPKPNEKKSLKPTPVQHCPPTDIDPPLKPLGEWIPPKTTLWQKIRGWFDIYHRYRGAIGCLKQVEALSDQRWEKLQMTERAFISVARPRYMNNSLPPNDRDLYEALCDFHGEEKLDEVPF